MPNVDFLFMLILKFSALAFLLLGAGTVALRFFNQPIERIRLIQISLASVFVAVILSLANFNPKFNLPWLPSASLAIAEEDSNLASEKISIAQKEKPHSNRAAPGDSAKPLDRSPVTGRIGSFPASERETKSTAMDPLNPKPFAAAQPLNVSNASAAGPILQPLNSVLTVIFVAVCSMQAIYLLLGFWATHRLIASASPLNKSQLKNLQPIFDQIALSKSVKITTTNKVRIPLAGGIWNPTIVLPENLLRAEADPTQVKHSLAHEWKHIEQKDLATWQLASFSQILLWPQPFYWMLRRELRVSQDQIADQFATLKTDDQAGYAATLVQFSQSHNSSLLGALTMAGTKSNLYRRIEMLLNNKFQLAGISRRRVVFGFASLMAVTTLFLASLQLTQAATSSNSNSPNTNLPATVQDETKTSENKTSDDKKADGNKVATAKKKKPLATKPVKHGGAVLDGKTNLPIAGATVIVTRMNSKTWTELDVTESKTNALGLYTFTIPVEQLNDPYLYIMFDLRHDTYAQRHCGSYSYSMIKRNLKLGALPWFTKLTMISGKKISGRLVDAQGKPVANAQIRVSSQAAGGNDFSSSSSTKTVSDKDGRFEAIVTKEGIARIAIIPIEHCMKYIDLGAKRGDISDITVSTGTSIKGKVLDAVGKPLENLWVNMRELEGDREGAYEMKRSSKTNANGEFQTRPLKPGKYEVQIETKATGALEKKKYANFKDDPPPSVFVRQIIEVAENDNKPFVIQAVPHIYVRGQVYNSKGEIASGHPPYVLGQHGGQSTWVRGKRGKQKGAFELMVPHGIEQARLSFMTNEHSALKIQFGDKKPTTQQSFEYDKIEEDITDIKVIRYVAPILQVKVIDESGRNVKKAGIVVIYKGEGPPDPRLIGPKTHVFFEKQTNGIHRSSQLVPGIEFTVHAEKEGQKSDSMTMTMAEGANKEITLTLKSAKTKTDDAKMMKKDDANRLPIK